MSSSNAAGTLFTRRRVLTAAAAVGVGGAAVSVAGLGVARDNRDEDDDSSDVVVHVRDAKSGRLDIFVGESRIEVRDRDLAASLVKAARRR